jgi:hypothetical protein
MSIRPGAIAFAVVGVGTALLLAGAAQPPKTDEVRIDAWIKQQQEIRDTLRASFQRPHPAVESTSEAAFRWPKHLKDHKKHTLINAEYDGQYTQHYLITVRTKETAEAETVEQERRNVAAALLNHYVGPLEALGFRSQKSPVVASIGPTLFEANTWEPEERYGTVLTADSPAWIEARVFFAPHEREAVIHITTGGRYIAESR